jgi:hypothetical protein
MHNTNMLRVNDSFNAHSMIMTKINRSSTLFELKLQDSQACTHTIAQTEFKS